MAGIFGFFDYTKEGPGINPGDPQKGPLANFFDIWLRKFWKIVTVNIMYYIFSLPILVLAWIIGSIAFPALFEFLDIESIAILFRSTSASEVSNIVSQGVSGGITDITSAEAAAILFIQLNTALSLALVGLQLLVFGPVHAGVTSIFRNYAREEHSFIWSDFKSNFIKNWKQSTVSSLIGLIGVVIIIINLVFYANTDTIKNEILNTVFIGLISLLAMVFTIMQMYIYPMIVTFKLTLKQIYKNAFLLTIARLPHNIGIVLISLFIILVIPLTLIITVDGTGVFLAILYYLLIGFGLNLMITNYFVYRQLKKYMIDPYYNAEKNSESGDEADKDDITQ